MRYVVMSPKGPEAGFAVPFSDRAAAEAYARECGEKMVAVLNDEPWRWTDSPDDWSYGVIWPDTMAEEFIVEETEAIGQGFDGGARCSYVLSLPSDYFSGGDGDPYIANTIGQPDGTEVPFRMMTEEEEAKYITE